jgi:CheY-like chemotaxis protein
MSKKNTILIVDDDTDDREIIRDAFKSSNNNHREYIFIETGDQLMEYLADASDVDLPSLILLDLNMPGKDGRETLKDIKASDRYRSIPTIIFTTSGSQKDKEMSYTLGANCFVTKPDTFNKLVELTNSISLIWLQENY